MYFRFTNSNFTFLERRLQWFKMHWRTPKSRFCKWQNWTFTWAASLTIYSRSSTSHVFSESNTNLTVLFYLHKSETIKVCLILLETLAILYNASKSRYENMIHSTPIGMACGGFEKVFLGLIMASSRLIFFSKVGESISPPDGNFFGIVFTRSWLFSFSKSDEWSFMFFARASIESSELARLRPRRLLLMNLISFWSS